MKYISILLFGLLIGCGETTPPPIIPPVVKQEQSVLPSLDKVEAGINNTVESNIKLEQKLKEQQQTVINQKIAIADAIQDAEKLKNKVLTNGKITELETTNLIDKLKDVESRNLFLELQNDELSKVREDQSQTLKTLKEDSDKTHDLLISKENEALQLREQTEYLSKNLIVKNKEVETLKNVLSDEKVKSATAGVYRNWIKGIVIGFVLWTIIKNIIMIYNPIKFRI
jgi:hypothetical protein